MKNEIDYRYAVLQVMDDGSLGIYTAGDLVEPTTSDLLNLADVVANDEGYSERWAKEMLGILKADHPDCTFFMVRALGVVEKHEEGDDIFMSGSEFLDIRPWARQHIEYANFLEKRAKEDREHWESFLAEEEEKHRSNG